MPIVVEHLTHYYSKGGPFEKLALDDVSFSIDDGDFIGLIGHTGSGKSTMIQHLNGLLKADSGTILVDGTDITQKGVKLSDIREKVGLVFQYPEHQLFEETVYKDIAFGPGNLGLGKEEIDKRVRAAAEMVGLEEKLLGKSPFDLSGGQSGGWPLRVCWPCSRGCLFWTSRRPGWTPWGGMRYCPVSNGCTTNRASRSFWCPIQWKMLRKPCKKLW